MKEAYRKQFGEENSIVKVNLAKGEIKLYAEKVIVEHVTNPITEISLKEAASFTQVPELALKILIEIPLRTLSSSAVMAARQVFMQGIAERKKEYLANIFQQNWGRL